MGLSILYQLNWNGTEDSAKLAMSEWKKQLQTADVSIQDLHPLGFKVRFAEGAETAKFELKQTEEGLTGFSGCKTQFAALQQHGGLPNFLKAHKRLIQMLETGKELGIVQAVTDDGGYWETRDEAKLTRQMQLGAQCIAWLTGTLGDAFSADAVKSPIQTEPHFEQLEAAWKTPAAN